MKTRILHTKIWYDGWFRNLAIDEKLFFLWLITNEYINILNLYEVNKEIAEHETKISIKRIGEILNKFNKDQKCDIFNDYILISNGYKYQHYSGIKNNYAKLRFFMEMGDKALKYYEKFVLSVIKDIQEETLKYGVTDNNFINLFSRIKKRLLEIPIDISTLDTNIQDTPISYTQKKPEIKNQKPGTRNTEGYKSFQKVGSILKKTAK